MFLAVVPDLASNVRDDDMGAGAGVNGRDAVEIPFLHSCIRIAAAQLDDLSGKAAACVARHGHA